MNFRFKEKNICVSEGCVKSAASILANVDKTVNPCDDFYQFACGKFTTGALVDDDKASRTTYSAVNRMVEDKIRHVLEEPINQLDSIHSKLAKQIYATCMDEQTLEKRGTQPLREILSKIGEWPVLSGNQWDEENFHWTDTVYKFRDHGLSIDYLIDLSVKINHKNTEAYIIELDRATLAMSSVYMKHGLKDKRVSSYYRYMVDVAVELGATEQYAKSELRRALDLEVQLARISQLQSLRHLKELFTEVTLADLARRYSGIPLREYINRLICGAGKTCVLNNDKIVVNTPHYLEGLEATLKFTSKRVLANYLVWRAVASSIAFCNRRVRYREQLWHEAVLGRPAREPRWTECVTISSTVVDSAVSALYVKQYFDKQTKTVATDMVKRIRKEFYHTLSKSDWIDPITKRNALDKAEAIEEFVGYPDELLDSLTVDKHYETFEKLRGPVNKTDWVTHGQAITVNAFYNLVENSIQLPAGILQGMFFSPDRPNYLNYGGIGYVIGHEITHGFDDQGRLYDKTGNLRDWWLPETVEKFHERTNCMIRQYSNYTVDKAAGLRIDGRHTIGENIADNGGVMSAYNAYRRWSADKIEPRLPGLFEYSPQQMFWINAANIWCSVYRPETLRHVVLTGLHAPGKFRVIGTLQNQPEFASDFNCSLGSYMHPQKKCKVW
ncbi:neprilysin-2-like [Daktulosphaira vitifoliae]|uniref:neprilysin-2-like n=1 Tax=Daktulosphaira vitifoliae TaxID=58002 RepID=UPI0021AA32FE|nr:neprilysin-2-like [Daktulosphaira vitifoliae]